MSLIVFIMGCTNAGKTTFMRYAKDKHPDKVGMVEVGEMMRAKYPPEYFKGQAAPEHTQQEAWDMCEGGVRKLVAEGCPVILVSGQPRSLHQVEACCTRLNDLGPKMYIYFDCNREVRAERLGQRFSLPEQSASLELGRQRLVNDEKTYAQVIEALVDRHVCINWVHTENPCWDEIFLRMMNGEYHLENYHTECRKDSLE